MMLAAAALALCHADAPASSATAFRQPIALEAGSYYEQGMAYLGSFAWAEAARSFHEVLRANPGSILGELRVAEAYSRAGLTREAEGHRDRAIELANSGRPTGVEQAWLRVIAAQRSLATARNKDRAARQSELDEAIGTLIRLDPGDIFARMPRPSLDGYRAAAEAAPESAGAHHMLVHAYEDVSDLAGAARHAIRYAELAPRHGHAHHLLAHLLPRQGQWDRALAALDRAAALGDASAHHSHLRAVLLLRAGRFEAAEEAFDDACRRGDCAPLAAYELWNSRPGDALASATEVRDTCRAIAVTGLAQMANGWLAPARKTLKASERACRDAEPGARMLTGALEALIDIKRGRTKQVEAGLLGAAKTAAGLPVWRSWAEGLFFLDFLSRETLHAGQGETAAQIVMWLLQIDPAFRERAGR